MFEQKSNGLVVNTSNDQEYEQNRNYRSVARDCMIDYINNISIYDLESVQQQSALLSSLTESTDEMTRTSLDKITDQCLRLIQVMETYTGSSAESLNIAAQNIVATLGNMIASLNIFLNGKRVSLLSDYIQANTYSDNFDVDLENFWTNPNNFDGETESEIKNSKNEIKSKYMSVDMIEKMEYVMDKLFDTMASHLTIGEDFIAETHFLNQILFKRRAADLPTDIILEGGEVKIPSYCDLIGEAGPSSYDPQSPPTAIDEQDCKQKVIILKIGAIPMSKSGHNGNNESFVGNSVAFSLKFYDENNIEIPMTNIKKPIQFWLKRDPLKEVPKFIKVNATKAVISRKYPFMPMVFSNMTSNSSIHIDIKPDIEADIGYLVLLKFGQTPTQRPRQDNADSVQLFCPPRKSNDYNGDYHYETQSKYLIKKLLFVRRFLLYKFKKNKKFNQRFTGKYFFDNLKIIIKKC
jgi:hypothetical protein